MCVIGLKLKMLIWFSLLSEYLQLLQKQIFQAIMTYRARTPSCGQTVCRIQKNLHIFHCDQSHLIIPSNKPVSLPPPPPPFFFYTFLHIQALCVCLYPSFYPSLSLSLSFSLSNQACLSSIQPMPYLQTSSFYLLLNSTNLVYFIPKALFLSVYLSHSCPPPPLSLSLLSLFFKSVTLSHKYLL